MFIWHFGYTYGQQEVREMNRMDYTWTLFYLTNHITLRSDHSYDGKQCSVRRSSAMRWDPHVLVQCTAVNIRFLLTIFKEGAGNDFAWLATHVISNKHIHCTL